MGKQYAVAMLFKQQISANEIQEELVLKVFSNCESPGDAFIKAFDMEKSTTNPKALVAKVIVEIPPLATTLSGEEGGGNG